MKKIILGLLIGASGVNAQVLTTSPAFPRANQPVTITVDVTGTSLADFTAYDPVANPVYVWAWIRKPGAQDANASTNVDPATAAQDAAKCTRVSANVYSFTFTPTTFFNRSVGDIPRIGIKLKTKAWADNKQSDVDKFIDFSTGFNAAFTTPTETSFFKNTGEQIPITVNASENATLTLKINGVTVATQENVSTLEYALAVTQTSGTTQVTCEAVAGSQSKTISFSYTIRTATVSQVRPAGIKDGINYSTDATKATLCLLAPGKSSVFVVGDFTNWDINASYLMKKDGERFWLEITGLTSGVEYAFQYLVDETVRIADPFADKILDPDDSFISATTYPSLKPFPAKAISDKWYFNRVSVLQTGQTPFVWKVTNFQKPPKEKLVIYELLVRDFFGANARNYQSLIDTLSYFKRLGINAIELMPITEFNGNESWGYNPTFMFAPDKNYGSKDKLKEFIDKCHQHGIAVILDIVMNQQDLPNAYLMQDFNFTTMKPNPTNRWFNVEATHPFNVFFDMNHESPYTKAYLDTINHYWINQYKVDGYRYDLSKGFTQTNSGSNVGQWSSRDASRIAILKRMFNKIRTYSSDAYVILEHFGDNAEETELSNAGMMLWANFNHAFNQATKGEPSDNDISGMYFANRGWSTANAIGYMESHDEERLMYNNKQLGRASGGYDAKNLNTALNRMKAASLIFYSIPGPKMLWQFGELGYDFSINTCPDLSINSNCRTAPKPVKWDYKSEPTRKSLFDSTASFLKLRNKYSVFTNGDATVSSGNGLVKYVAIKNKPFVEKPTTTDAMNVVAVANFDVVTQTQPINFPHTGVWYDYFAGGTSITIGSVTTSIELLPGQYRLYTDVSLVTQPVTGLEDNIDLSVELFPNPTYSILKIESSEKIISVNLVSTQGTRSPLQKIDASSWDASTQPTGLYIAEIFTESRLVRRRIVKK